MTDENKPSPKRRAKSGASEPVSGAELPPAPPPPPPPPPLAGPRQLPLRSLQLALAVSVALNLLVAGVAVGSLFHNGGMDGRAEMSRDLGFGPFGEALAPNDRRALRDYLQQKSPQLRGANKQRYADLAALQAALRAQPFDPAALTSALDGMRGRMEGQLKLGHEALAAVILRMPDQERLAMADRLERGMRRGGPGEDEKPRDGPQKGSGAGN